MTTFDHEKLDVYHLAIEFAAKADEIVGGLPRGRRYLADQLQRAALSIVLNIAEGSGKFSSADKAVFYLRARGSTTECAACLDVCRKLKILAHDAVEENKAILIRITQMLTKLIKSHSKKEDGDLERPVPVPVPEPGFSPGPGVQPSDPAPGVSSD